MSFRVAITRRAAREIEDHYRWLAQRSRGGAERWRDSLLQAIDSLEDDPERWPEAEEAVWFGAGLRQLLHGKQGRVYRILFEIRENLVVILRVRHSAQDLLGPGDL